MPPFKMPGFQERREAAALARSAALEQYRAKPPVDAAVVAERIARDQARKVAEAEKKAALRLAKEQAAEAHRQQELERAVAAEAASKTELEAAAQARADAAEKKAAAKKLWTEDDRKAARDARYAARKMRTRGR